MSDNVNIELTYTNHVAHICLNNPEKHNSLSGDDIRLFLHLLESVENNPEIRVLIVTGSGEKTFCSGASLAQLSTGETKGDQFVDLADKLAELKIPTICSMNGSVYGGGVELGLCCDFRVGLKGTKLFVPPARFGICYPTNGIKRYVNRLGINLAKRILIASEDFTSEQMLELGYFTHLVEREELVDHVQTLADRIAGWAPLATSSMKQISNQIADGNLDSSAAEALIQQCSHSKDLEEGLAAIKEKRKPAFTGH